jgi:hypothetical protein
VRYVLAETHVLGEETEGQSSVPGVQINEGNRGEKLRAAANNLGCARPSSENAVRAPLIRISPQTWPPPAIIARMVEIRKGERPSGRLLDKRTVTVTVTVCCYERAAACQVQATGFRDA